MHFNFIINIYGYSKINKLHDLPINIGFASNPLLIKLSSKFSLPLSNLFVIKFFIIIKF